jgi:hypothetical protein
MTLTSSVGRQRHSSPQSTRPRKRARRPGALRTGLSARSPQVRWSDREPRVLGVPDADVLDASDAGSQSLVTVGARVPAVLRGNDLSAARFGCFAEPGVMHVMWFRQARKVPGLREYGLGPHARVSTAQCAACCLVGTDATWTLSKQVDCGHPAAASASVAKVTVRLSARRQTATARVGHAAGNCPPHPGGRHEPRSTARRVRCAQQPCITWPRFGLHAPTASFSETTPRLAPRADPATRACHAATVPDEGCRPSRAAYLPC